MAIIDVVTNPNAWWTFNNPVLPDGVLGVESDVRNGVQTDTGKAKMGDGVTRWNSLGYFSPNGAGGGSGDVIGPVSSTDKAVTRWSGIAGDEVQDSGVIVDDNNNVKANNFVGSFATTATAAGTTVLTAASASIQEFTGAAVQTITLPVVSTLATGWGFAIINKSSGALTINSSGGNLVKTAAADTTTIVTANAIVGTGAAVWDVTYITASAGITNGAGANVVPKSNGTNLVASVITDNATDVTISPAAAGSVILQQAATPTDHLLKAKDSADAQLMAISKDGYLLGTTDTQRLYLVGAAGVQLQYNDDNRFDIGSGQMNFRAGSAANISAKLDTGSGAGTTALLLWDVDNATLERVTVGAPDSGGAGFKVLRIPN